LSTWAIAVAVVVVVVVGLTCHRTGLNTVQLLLLSLLFVLLLLPTWLWRRQQKNTKKKMQTCRQWSTVQAKKWRCSWDDGKRPQKTTTTRHLHTMNCLSWLWGTHR